MVFVPAFAVRVAVPAFLPLIFPFDTSAIAVSETVHSGSIIVPETVLPSGHVSSVTICVCTSGTSITSLHATVYAFSSVESDSI